MTEYHVEIGQRCSLRLSAHWQVESDGKDIFEIVGLLTSSVDASVNKALHKNQMMPTR